VAWKPSPGGEDGWIPMRTQALGSGFRVSGQTDASPPWRAVRLAGDDRSGGHGLQLRLSRVGWLSRSDGEGRGSARTVALGRATGAAKPRGAPPYFRSVTRVKPTRQAELFE
jgi:hypothetical protein